MSEMLLSGRPAARSLVLRCTIGALAAVAVGVGFWAAGVNIPIVPIIAVATASAVGSWLLRVELDADDALASPPTGWDAVHRSPACGDHQVRRTEQSMRESATGPMSRRLLGELADLVDALPSAAAASLPSDLREVLDRRASPEPLPSVPRHRLRAWLRAIAEAARAADPASPPVRSEETA